MQKAWPYRRRRRSTESPGGAHYLAGSTLDDSFVIALGGKTQSGSVKSVADGAVDGLDLYRYELTLATPFAVTGVTPLELALVNDSFDVERYWQGAATLDGRRALVMLQVPEPGKDRYDHGLA